VRGAKEWLSNIHGHISSTTEVLHFNRLFRSLRTRTLREPTGLAATWCNIAFSHDGIEKLASRDEADALPDEAFRLGMPERAVALLGDPASPTSPYSPNNWKIGARGNIPDIILIIASDQKTLMEQLVETLLKQSAANALTVLATEAGAARTDLPGHEHFGFKDGISQPGVRGRASKSRTDFITPRLIDPSDPLSENFARPGQPLIMPGHFVLGYQTQDPTDGSVQRAVAPAFKWFRNGSFLVFRRLRQDVAAFRDFVTKAAATIKVQPGFDYVSTELLESVLVGRWPNGAPVTRSPDLPSPTMAADISANAFAFANALGMIKLRPGVKPDATPPAPADALARLCPHWSHIRKVNPRDDVTDLGDGFDTLTRRMIRRGIPYGEPLTPGRPDDGVDRGLLFLAYHASIEQSFEKITSDWVNQTQNPSPDGHDPIMGQTNADGSRVRRIVLPSRKDSSCSFALTIDREWVLPTGGGYFFAPSLSAIAEHLSAFRPGSSGM